MRWRHLPALAPWLIRFARAGTAENVARTARALRALLAPSLACLDPLVRNAGAGHLVEQRGHLVVYRSDAAFAKEEPHWDLRRDNGITWETLGPDELRQLEPALSRDYVRGRFIAENGHTSDPHRLVCALAEALVRDGAEIRRARATGFELDGRRLTSVRTDHGADRGGCCNRGGGRVLGAACRIARRQGAARDRAGLSPDAARSRGGAAHTRRPRRTGSSWRRRCSGGLRFAGTVEFAGLEAAPDWRRARVLLAQGQRMFPALAGAPDEARISVWMGHRPSLPDLLPVLGASRRSPDVIHAFGHGHVGMAAAPMTGKIVSDLVAGRDPGIDMAPYRAARFA